MSTAVENDIEKPLSAPEKFRGTFFAALLLWLNVYICREMFTRYSPKMNSMQGFWIAMARHAGGGWFHSTWWRYWDCGIPVEFVYAPLIPTLSAWTAAVRGIHHDVAFQSVSGAVYCLAPVTLFLMTWLLTRAAGYAFAAGLVYSLTSPSQLLVPDTQFAWVHFWDARRLYLTAVWDETPHQAALAVLPLVILFLSLAIRKRRPVYYAASVVAIAVCALASDFGPVLTVMASLCLLFVLRREKLAQNLLIIAGIGFFAYAIGSPFLTPTKIQATGAASASIEEYWNAGSFTALIIVGTGWAVLWACLPRWTSKWPLHFFALFTWLTCSVPLMAEYLHRQFLPQPMRYKVEMEFCLAIVGVFAMRPVFRRIPTSVGVWLVLLIVAFTREQLVAERKFAKAVLFPVDATKTIEYRVAMWTQDHLPGVRVSLPGSISQWANAFTDVEQFSGGSWSVAYNPIQQRALREILNGSDAGVSIRLLKAFGTGAVAVPGPKSPEFWKGFSNPKKFDGVLPVLWSEDDTTIYRVPLRSKSRAHVVPESALPKGSSNEDVGNYVTALEDLSLPTADFQWEDTNRIRVTTVVRPDQAVSVQVTHHPGWHAKANGVARPVKADGLGLIWVQPGCNGPCDIRLEYDGGTELFLARLLRAAALATMLIFFGWKAFRVSRG